ncbi:MAG: TIGR03088 family PEP-CTERM/XrtA system glycosyltransferase [Pseudomonadota bacterium]
MKAPPPLVAHIIYQFSTGGLENGLVNLINRSPPGRYRHAIICMTGAGEFANRITVPDVDVIEMHKRRGHDLRYFRELAGLLRQLRPAIIHSRNLAALESQICGLGIRHVRRVHGEHGREITDVDGTNWKYLALRRAMRLLVHQYIAVSRDLETWLRERVGVPPEKVQQIYNGVDCARFAPRTVKPLALLPEHWQSLDDILIVGTVGRLTPVKDQQTLLRALAILRDTQPHLGSRLKVILVGDGDLRAHLHGLTEELELTDAVWFAGDRDDVPELLAAMDVFVLPSLGEGISNTVLEAFATGVPVLATAVGGNVELVKEGVTGGLFGVGDATGLSEALADLLEDDEARRRMGEQSVEFVRQHFSWDRTVDAYLGVYDQLLSGVGAH